MPLAINTQHLHPASALCLEALQWLHAREEFANILEIGCGSGILSVACASIWDANIIAADISPKAVFKANAGLENNAGFPRVLDSERVKSWFFTG